VQQLCSRFLAHAVASQQSLRISQHCCSAAAQVAIITRIRLLGLLKKKRNLLPSGKKRKPLPPEKEKKRLNITPFSVNLMRSQVLYRAA